LASGGVRQRWRICFRYDGSARGGTHRDIASEWVAKLSAHLPLAGSPTVPGGRPRPALTFAAPLPSHVECHRELADVALSECLPVWQVRAAIADTTPSGINVAEVFDVWAGSTAIAAEAAAADYVVRLSGTPDQGVLAEAVAALLDSPSVERTRNRGDRKATYDLRPLVESVAVEADDDGNVLVTMRTRFDPERGPGRPEEVVAALAELAKTELQIERTTRERVLLRDDLV
jgi:radical SAM-linked protein